MSLRLPLLSGLFLLALAGCKPAAAPSGLPSGALPGEAEVQAAPSEESERVWSGLLPCSDCQGIDTRLVLRTEQGQRRYELTETYLGGAGKNSFNRSGAWTELQRNVDGESQVTYVLDPEQGAQRYALQPDGALEMLDASGKAPNDVLDYRLQRL